MNQNSHKLLGLSLAKKAGSLWKSPGNCGAIVLGSRYVFPPLTLFEFRQAPPERPLDLQGHRVYMIHGHTDGLTFHLVRQAKEMGQTPFGNGGQLPLDTFAFAGQAFFVIVLLLRRPSPSAVHSQNEKQHAQPHGSHDKVKSTTNHPLLSNQLREGSGPFKF